jgi:hypothetical protein
VIIKDDLRKVNPSNVSLRGECEVFFETLVMKQKDRECFPIMEEGLTSAGNAEVTEC